MIETGYSTEDYFSYRLKKLRKGKGIKQKDAAFMLGLSQSALANYEKGIRFPDQETLKRISEAFAVSLDYLLGVKLGPVSGFSDNDMGGLPALEASYKENLFTGRKEEALSHLIAAAQGGYSAENLYITVLEPALKEIGDLWERGELSIAEEHLHSREIERAINLITYTVLKTPLTGKSCVCAAAGGELHGIGLSMIASLLTIRGWTVWHLGTNTPMNEAITLASEKGAAVLAVSATLPYHLDSIKHLIEANSSAALTHKAKILVGGQAFAENSDTWKELGADGYAPDLLGAVAEAERLSG